MPMVKNNIIEKSMHPNPKMVVWCSIELRAQVKASNLKKENKAIFFSVTFKTTLFSLPSSDHGRMSLTYHEGNVLLKIVLFRFMSLWSTIWARAGFEARCLSPSSRLAHSCTIFLCPLDVGNIDDWCRCPSIKEKDHLAAPLRAWHQLFVLKHCQRHYGPRRWLL